MSNTDETPDTYADSADEHIAELRALVLSATMFRLGKEHDNDRRDYVSVHRQYGVPEHQRWAVAVCGEQPMRVVLTFSDQSVALFYAARLLREIPRVVQCA
jgi:hypothetical protein